MPATASQKAKMSRNAAVLARVDSWQYLKYFAFTKDEHDKGVVYKRLPHRAYLRVLARAWDESERYPIVLMEKTRQIICTWFVCLLLAREVALFTNRQIGIQSKTEGDSDKSVGRVEHSLEPLFKWRPEEGGWPYRSGRYALSKPKTTNERFKAAKRIYFPGSKSEIHAVAQGQDVVRQQTYSILFSDEIGHQRDWYLAYKAGTPTTGAKGRYWGQGTANGYGPDWMLMNNVDVMTGDRTGDNKMDSRRIARPRLQPPEGMSTEDARWWIENALLEMPDETPDGQGFKQIPLDELFACVPGMEVWETQNGILGMRLHYSADPYKSPETEAGREWIRREKIGKTHDQWEMEYEINRGAFDGRPVIGNWSRDVFVKPLTYDTTIGVRNSCDFGYQVACFFFAQLVPVRGFDDFQLRILREIVLRNSGTPQMAKLAVEIMKAQFSKAWVSGDLRTFPDPTGMRRQSTTSDSSLNTDVKILYEAGLKPGVVKHGVVPSTNLVKAVFAHSLPNGEPAVVIDPSCEYLISCVGGGWHFPLIPVPRHLGKPEKDGVYDHGGDALRFLVANCFDPSKYVDTREKPQVTFSTIKLRTPDGRIYGTRRVAKVRGKEVMRDYGLGFGG